MDERPKKRRGPITIFTDLFMADPAITGLVIFPVVIVLIFLAIGAFRAAVAWLDAWRS